MCENQTIDFIFFSKDKQTKVKIFVYMQICIWENNNKICDFILVHHPPRHLLRRRRHFHSHLTHQLQLFENQACHLKSWNFLNRKKKRFVKLISFESYLHHLHHSLRSRRRHNLHLMHHHHRNRLLGRHRQPKFNEVSSPLFIESQLRTSSSSSSSSFTWSSPFLWFDSSSTGPSPFVPPLRWAFKAFNFVGLTSSNSASRFVPEEQNSKSLFFCLLNCFSTFVNSWRG